MDWSAPLPCGHAAPPGRLWLRALGRVAPARHRPEHRPVRRRIALDPAAVVATRRPPAVPARRFRPGRVAGIGAPGLLAWVGDRIPAVRSGPAGRPAHGPAGGGRAARR